MVFELVGTTKSIMKYNMHIYVLFCEKYVCVFNYTFQRISDQNDMLETVPIFYENLTCLVQSNYLRAVIPTNCLGWSFHISRYVNFSYVRIGFLVE